MNKTEKINFLRNAIGTRNICRCYFGYSADYWYFNILDVSDKLLLGAEEDDFLIDGFQIRKLSDLKKAEIKDDLCVKIIEESNVLKAVEKPSVDITCWETVFESLKAQGNMIIVENDTLEIEFFYLGYITEVKKSYLVFSHVDADGQWYEGIQIPYAEVTSVTFGDRYSTSWQNYLQKHNLLPN